jgi:hypothetical protein
MNIDTKKVNIGKKKICTSTRKYVHRLIINKLQRQKNHRILLN